MQLIPLAFVTLLSFSSLSAAEYCKDAPPNCQYGVKNSIWLGCDKMSFLSCGPKSPCAAQGRKRSHCCKATEETGAAAEYCVK
ncbi:putative transporter [Venturia nashicola]|uniref:Putative transporter n=1 Tax=Venturia nashicola TaxID=86259 RepID=A0A4Z1PD33_9PEZI|nr:putative transporter [Venturia nashicola]TLD35837.1 putative transporter [Venturia nashicola]